MLNSSTNYGENYYYSQAIVMFIINFVGAVFGLDILVKDTKTEMIDQCNGSKIFYIPLIIFVVGFIMSTINSICFCFSKTCFTEYVKALETKTALIYHYINIIFSIGWYIYFIYGVEYICDNNFKNSKLFIFLMYHALYLSIFFINEIKYTSTETTAKFCPDFYVKCCTV